MTYEQLEIAMEELGYNIAALSAEEVEALGKTEGFKRGHNGKYYYNLY